MIRIVSSVLLFVTPGGAACGGRPRGPGHPRGGGVAARGPGLRKTRV